MGTDFRNSETKVNLMRAFAGESQARNRYTFAADKMKNQNLQVLEQIIDQELSSFEKQVLDLYLTGMSYVQIARVLGKDGKSADNALQRIKSKLRRATGR